MTIIKLDTPCSDIERLWGKIMSFYDDEGSFLHFLICERCREELQFELDYTLFNDFAAKYIPTGEDVQRVMQFLEKKKREKMMKEKKEISDGLWERLWALLHSHEKSDESPPHSLFRMGVQIFCCVFAPMPAMVTDVHSEAEGVPDKPELMIVFSAELPKGDPYYWTATLTVPSGATPDMVVSFVIRDVDQAPVHSGVFLLFDQRLPIEDGIATIRWGLFLENCDKHSVGIIFPSGRKVMGLLEYF